MLHVFYQQKHLDRVVWTFSEQCIVFQAVRSRQFLAEWHCLSGSSRLLQFPDLPWMWVEPGRAYLWVAEPSSSFVVSLCTSLVWQVEASDLKISNHVQWQVPSTGYYTSYSLMEIFQRGKGVLLLTLLEWPRTGWWAFWVWLTVPDYKHIRQKKILTFGHFGAVWRNLCRGKRRAESGLEIREHQVLKKLERLATLDPEETWSW